MENHVNVMFGDVNMEHLKVLESYQIQNIESYSGTTC